MGLTSWKGTRVRKGDVTISKNYLDSDEISTLNMLTTQFLDFAELRARRRQAITMAEWVEATDRFITMNDMKVLSGSGRISSEEAVAHAHTHFASFDVQRRELEAARAEQEAAQETREILAGRDERLLGDLERIEEDIERQREPTEREDRP
jgi:hypothetical protein